MSDSYCLSTIHDVVHAEFKVWGLNDWKFVLNNRNCHLGLCNATNKTIALSKNHVEHSSKHSVMDTIRHEIAHALHYLHYVHSGREADFWTRSRSTGRRFVKPHGREWKKFAVMVGANPRGTTDDYNLDESKTYKWKLVVVHNDTDIEDAKYSCGRFLVRLNTKWLRSRKDTKGKLFLVDASVWDKVSKTDGPYNTVVFYQSPPQKGRVIKVEGSRLTYVK